VAAFQLFGSGYARLKVPQAAWLEAVSEADEGIGFGARRSTEAFGTAAVSG